MAITPSGNNAAGEHGEKKMKTIEKEVAFLLNRDGSRNGINVPLTELEPDGRWYGALPGSGVMDPQYYATEIDVLVEHFDYPPPEGF